MAINDAIVFSHTPTMIGNTSIESQIPEPTSQRSRFHPKGNCQGRRTSTLVVPQHSISLNVRVVGVPNANRVSSSVSVTALEVSVLHTVTRNFSNPFSASYFDSLASSSSRSLCLAVSGTVRSIRTATTFILTTILWLIVGSRHSFAFSMKP